MSAPLSSRTLSRREALGRIAAAAALLSTRSALWGQDSPAPIIGWDPNLLKKEIPWPRLLTDGEKKIVTLLGDIILPADQFGPAASAVGVPDFIDEWVSAPYDQQVKERKILRDGFAWLDGQGFAAATPEKQVALVQEIAKPGTEARKQAHAFFLLFRDRAMGGYFTTPEGWKALGYTGNLPSAEFAGPPPEALAHVGLA